MKPIAAISLTLLLSSLATISTKAATIIDDFNGSSLDGTTWNYSLPFAESSLSVGGGSLTLNNRAIISTVAQFAEPITMSGSLMASRYDTIRVSTRTNLTVHDAYTNELDGLHFSFHFDSNSIQIADANGNELALASYTFNTGQWYDFVITDDGSNLTWSINGIPQLSAIDNVSTGNYLSIYNREVNHGWAIPSSTSFNYLQITGTPEPSRSMLLLIGLSLGFCSRRRAAEPCARPVEPPLDMHS
ncbi:MAG: PEP-CTERM sorting domain-containing protein [Fimbriimonadaceae bacterium]